MVDKVGKNCCYDKVLAWAMKKIHFYASYERIADFSAYRLKCLERVGNTLG